MIIIIVISITRTGIIIIIIMKAPLRNSRQNISATLLVKDSPQHCSQFVHIAAIK